MRAERVLVWRGLDAWRAELAHVRITEGALQARGTQIGVEPEPYELRYRLETEGGFVTRSLFLTASGDGWGRRLELVRADDGGWTANGEPLPEVEGALDCDLQNSPLTNTMPILRDALLGDEEPRDYVMAWVAVPELTVHRSEQRYEPLDDRRVRYVSARRDFIAELELDEEGLVVRYPQLGERVEPVSSAPA